MSKRLIKINYDVNGKRLLNKDGYPLSIDGIPFLAYKEQVLVNLQLVKNTNLEPYTELPTGVSYSCTLDNDYDHTDEPFCKTLNDKFNLENEWDYTSTADPALGQLSFSLDGFTSIFQTNIGTASQLTNTKLEIQLLSTDDSSLVFVRSFDFFCKNIMDDSGAVPPTGDASNYWTKTESDARYTQETNILTKDNTAAFIPTGDYNPATKKYVDDQAGNDANAVHTDTSDEINDITEKTSIVNGDIILIEDSEDSFNKKKVQIENLPSGGDVSALESRVEDNEDDIITLSGDVITNTNEILSLDSDLTDLAGDIIDNTTLINTNINDIAANTTLINTNINDIASNTASINDLNFKRIHTRLTENVQFIDLADNIDITETTTIILKDSPILTPNYGFYISGNRIILDNDIEFSSKDPIDITYVPLVTTDDIINWSTETSQSNFNDFHMQCIPGETEDVHVYWGDETDTIIPITDVKSQLNHTYDGAYTGTLRNCMALADFSKIEALWFDNSTGNAQIFWAGLKQMTALKRLRCQENNLDTVDLSNNTLLEDIQFGGNNFKSIDLSNNPLLEIIHLYDNKLLEIDLGSNTNLTHVYMSNNELIEFTVTSEDIIYLDLSHNSIPCGADNGSETGTLNKVLKDLDTNGKQNGFLDLSDQDPENVVSPTLVGALTAKGWTVQL